LRWVHWFATCAKRKRNTLLINTNTDKSGPVYNVASSYLMVSVSPALF
jgi:hypothetical protein